MIKVYKNRGYDALFNKATAWLDKYRLPYKVVTQTNLLYGDLKHILSLSDGGFEEIMISQLKAKKLYETLPKNFEELNTEEMLNLLLANQKFLRTPLIFDDKHLSVGYNPEAIRTFIPRVRRRVS